MKKISFLQAIDIIKRANRIYLDNGLNNPIIGCHFRPEVGNFPAQLEMYVDRATFTQVLSFTADENKEVSIDGSSVIMVPHNKNSKPRGFLLYKLIDPVKEAELRENML